MRSSLMIPAQLGYLRPVAAYIKALAETEGFDSTEISSIELAAEEIFTNIVEHGFPGVSDASFHLDIEVQAAGLSLVFKAKGMPFDPERLPQYDSKTAMNGGSLQGLGLFLARQAVDHLIFHNNGRDGYSIELIKMLGRKRIDRYPGVEAQQTSAEADKAAISFGGDLEYTIRPLLPEEAIEISRCAYQAYGYSYEDFIYYPDRIIELNRSGRMHSLVAVTTGGDIMGHTSLKRTNPADVIAEVGVLIVKPEYRKSGIAVQLSAAIKEKGRGLGLSALYTRAVAGHALSQKISVSLGAGDCAILLGAFPSKVEFKSLTGTIQQKMSGVVQWVGLGSPRQRRIFSTSELIPQLVRIYEGLGLPVTCGAAPGNGWASDLPESSQLSLFRDKVLDTAIIEVREYGRDLLEQLRLQLRIQCLEQTPVIYLHLNVEHPATAQVLPRLREMGFFFSGVIPYGLAGADALILQYLNNLEIDYESIRLYKTDSLELLAFIKGMDPVQRDLAGVTKKG